MIRTQQRQSCQSPVRPVGNPDPAQRAARCDLARTRCPRVVVAGRIPTILGKCVGVRVRCAGAEAGTKSNREPA